MLNIQIKSITGESAYLDELDNESLVHFINSEMPSVVVFEDKKYVTNFMNFGINRFTNKIRFATSNLANAKDYGSIIHA